MDDFDRFDEFERRLAGALRSDADLSVSVQAGGHRLRGRRDGEAPRGPHRIEAHGHGDIPALTARGGGRHRRARARSSVPDEHSQPPVVGHPSPTPATVPSPAFRASSRQVRLPVTGSASTTPPRPGGPRRVWARTGPRRSAPSLPEAPMIPPRSRPADTPIRRATANSDAGPSVDLREVQFATSDVRSRVADPPPAVDPAQRWIAYGVVVDDDRDGIPDWRLGMDNLPLAVGDGQNHRAWRTDLHTGRTTAHDPAYCCITGVVLDSFYPRTEPNARFIFGGETTAGRATGLDPDAAFYAWASVIEDGRVVATDYAPDVGWLSRDAPFPRLPWRRRQARQASRVRPASGSRQARWARRAPAIPPCGSSMVRVLVVGGSRR